MRERGREMESRGKRSVKERRLPQILRDSVSAVTDTPMLLHLASLLSVKAKHTSCARTSSSNFRTANVSTDSSEVMI